MELSDWLKQIQSKQSETERAPQISNSQSTSAQIINLQFAKLAI